MTRRASAPRLIEWTGERCVPWAPDVQVIYEHLHRYLWVRSFVAGKAVLDLGSGEGFGSSILADAAARVHGVDIDETTVTHARLNYGADHVTFDVADATALSADLDGQFDVVVAFEVLEHVVDHDALIAGVRRVLKPGGVCVISTPNRLLYETVEGGNPYHLHELSDMEFEALLAGSFATHTMLAQRVAEGSRIDARDAGARETEPFRLERAGDGWAEVGPSAPYYLIAVATDGELPSGLGGSTLLDHTLQLMRKAEYDGVQQLVQARGEAQAAQQTLADAQQALADAQQVLAASHERAAGSLRQRDEAVAVARTQAVELLAARSRAEAAEAQVAQSGAELVRRLAEVNESISWRIFQKVRRRWRGTGEHPRLAARAGGRVLRTASQLRQRPVAGKAAASQRDTSVLLTVPGSSEPDVSIVIPVYSRPDLTLACLRAVVAATVVGPSYEILVVDDCADDETKEMLARVEGIRVLTNPENLGFLKSVNRGVAQARGETIVLLNNDTEPQPGWLAALTRRLSSADSVGAVGGRLIYPSGELQEAGGVLFADGSAVNYGNGNPPQASAYRFARTVDYCSAALLAIRKGLWEQLGGFDELFVPGYYEDTDLCFRVRDAGKEVWYEPQAIAIHHEGGSHGTDVTHGVKRHQVVNQQRFIDRWRSQLADRPPTASAAAAVTCADRRDGPVVVIADHIVPEPDRDSGSLRMFQIIEEFTRQGARVVFVPANRHATPGYSEALEANGVEILDGTVPMQSRLADLRGACQLVLLSRPSVAAQFLPEFRAVLPSATVVFDTVDLHWLREDARREFEPVSPGTVTAYRELELAMIRATDITAVVSELERTTVEGEVPGKDIRYLPNVHAIVGASPGFSERRGLLFVGGFRHLPNVDAARQLGLSIMPQIRVLGLDTRLTIVGPDAPEDVVGLQGVDLDVLGWVPEIEPLLDASLALIAPLRYGAGMKGKVGQALAHGLPVITTSVGAQGFGLRDGEEALIAETPEEFAQAVARLMADPELWQRLADNGRAVIERTCSTAIIAESVAGLLASASDTSDASDAAALTVASQ